MCKKEDIYMDIKGAIFDMDGTLVDSLSFWEYFYKAVGVKYGVGENFCPDESVERIIRTSTFKQGMALMHRACGIGNSADELENDAITICADFYKKIVTVKDGVLEFLEYCLDKGVKMCVASATQKDLLNIVVERFGFDRYFSAVISCGDIGKGKEHPDVFLAALEHLGTPIESTYVFEDSVVAVETAVKAGFGTVGIYDKYGFGHDRIKSLATEYIGQGETMMKLMKGTNDCV